MIDATYVEMRRTASSLKKGSEPRLIGRTKGGMNSKLTANSMCAVRLHKHVQCAFI